MWLWGSQYPIQLYRDDSFVIASWDITSCSINEHSTTVQRLWVVGSYIWVENDWQPVGGSTEQSWCRHTNCFDWISYLNGQNRVYYYKNRDTYNKNKGD